MMNGSGRMMYEAGGSGKGGERKEWEGSERSIGKERKRGERILGKEKGRRDIRGEGGRVYFYFG